MGGDAAFLACGLAQPGGLSPTGQAPMASRAPGRRAISGVEEMDGEWARGWEEANIG